MHAVSIRGWEEVGLAPHVTVMRKIFESSFCERLRANKPCNKPQKISNNSARTDGSRTQEDLSKELKEEVASAVLQKLQTHVPCASLLTLVTPKLLRSRQSAQNQRLHYDFLDGELAAHVKAHGTAPGRQVTWARRLQRASPDKIYAHTASADPTLHAQLHRATMFQARNGPPIVVSAPFSQKRYFT
jgi:hypothetical protein